MLYTIDRIRKWEPPEPASPDSIVVVVWVAESTDLPPPGPANTDSFYIARSGFVAVSYSLERLCGQWRVTARTERP